ncbi:3-oxoacyl-[acyl-carrier-protein] synthase 2 [Striga asiatica]|uniref:3-oxoacyl-[acyl-carrier-protein] synthase 2 n=1 Tax=Striga asiatica TaxID=4170 RepID=A0A5A7NXB8_STRAF|nr:3-oxoacyl-[acyl-carrier-protein] synthase 2 [Striga asiatica]
MSALSVIPITVATFSLSQSRKPHKPSKNFAKRLDSRVEFQIPSKNFAKRLDFRVDFLKPSKIFAKRLDSRVDFNCRDSVSWARRTKTQNIMIYGVNGVRASTNDESIEVFEQDAFVDGSSKLGAGRLEATLNSLNCSYFGCSWVLYWFSVARYSYLDGRGTVIPSNSNNVAVSGP